MAPPSAYRLRRRFHDSRFDFDDLIGVLPLQPEQHRPFWASISAFVLRAPARRAMSSSDETMMSELVLEFLLEQADHWFAIDHGFGADDPHFEMQVPLEISQWRF